MLHVLVLSTAFLAHGQPVPPAAPVEPVVADTTPRPLPPISDSARVVLDRMIAHFAPLPGVRAIAKHRIEAPNKTILHETVREIVIVKPNRISVTQNGIPFLVSNGTDAWTLPQQGTVFNELKAPATMPDCITEFRALGNGGIAGSGGLVAALLSPNALGELLKEVDQVGCVQKGEDDLLILRIGSWSKRLRDGLRLGIFVPRNGDPWPSQLDVIPPGAEVFTRIAFSDWSVADPLSTEFTKPVITAPDGTFNPVLGWPTKSNVSPPPVTAEPPSVH